MWPPSRALARPPWLPARISKQTRRGCGSCAIGWREARGSRPPPSRLFAENVDRLPNTTLLALPGMKAETAVIAFDLEGVAVSSGAACSSGKVAPSHVLAAMGVAQDLARGAIRVSLGYATSDEDVGTILKAWGKLSESLYKAGNQREIAA